MSLVQRFNTECLRRGVIGVVPSGRLAGRADYRFSRHHVDEQRRALRRVVEEKLPFIAEDPRYDVCVHLTRNLPLSSLLNEVRRLCASIEVRTPHMTVDALSLPLSLMFAPS
jgi:hypothetical protein